MRRRSACPDAAVMTLLETIAAPAQPPAAGWPPAVNWPNTVTALRTVLAVTIGLFAVVHGSGAALLVAYAVYWVGDVLDGWLARLLRQETRLGAVLDIISDRACCAVLACGLAVLYPNLGPALTIFLLQFMVLDCLLSLAFLAWPIDSPNDFHLVDRTVWRINWSPPAKALNTVAVVAAVAAGSLPLALSVAVGQVLLKSWSARRLFQLGLPAADRPC